MSKTLNISLNVFSLVSSQGSGLGFTVSSTFSAITRGDWTLFRWPLPR
jgi:hypothetical protein